MSSEPAPSHLHLERAKGLTIEWADGHSCFYPVEWLRRMSPSADQRELRSEMKHNPLTVLPPTKSTGPQHADRIEQVGNYALRIYFSDGHSAGIYSWKYFREIEPETAP